MQKKDLRVLIVGDGGREKAIEDSIAKSKLIAAIEHTAEASIGAIVRYAVNWAADLVVVGPEKPLIDGIADAFAQQASNIPLFGPSAAAAKLEGSKIYCKRLCLKYGVPTAPFSVARSYDEAETIIQRRGAPLVVKADGLMAGKGVRVCATVPEALFFARKLFSSAGSTAAVLLEDALLGREVSVMALCDGDQSYLLPAAHDYKRLKAGSEDMTGGMGAYSPFPAANTALLKRIKRDIVDQLLHACRTEGHPYHGVLYAGIMLTRKGPKLIEVNCRFGDPEAQVIIPRIQNDLLPYLLATTRRGALKTLPPIRWNKDAAVCVCVASKDYPAKGRRLHSIVGMGPTIAAARERAYQKVRMLSGIKELQYREDIAAGV